jgi:hypothetical protein
MPLIVTFSEEITSPALGLLQGLAPSTTVRSIHFSLSVVPAIKGSSTRPPVSDWLAIEDPGGILKLNEYLLFRYDSQPAVSVPETLISTHHDFVAPAPIPNRTPAAFWNLQ